MLYFFLILFCNKTLVYTQIDKNWRMKRVYCHYAECAVCGERIAATETLTDHAHRADSTLYTRNTNWTVAPRSMSDDKELHILRLTRFYFGRKPNKKHTHTKCIIMDILILRLTVLRYEQSRCNFQSAWTNKQYWITLEHMVEIWVEQKSISTYLNRW